MGTKGFRALYITAFKNLAPIAINKKNIGAILEKVQARGAVELTACLLELSTKPKTRCAATGFHFSFRQNRNRHIESFDVPVLLSFGLTHLKCSMAQVSSAQLYCVIYSP